jgi:alginate O-acetyltransferase complex protein AlgI
MIVFFFTGLWHGANWTFVLWGLYHGMFLLLEQYVPLEKKLPKFLGHIYTLLVVCVGFVLFRADTITQGGFFIRQMFTGFFVTAETTSLVWQQLTPWFFCMLAAAVLGAAPIRILSEKLKVSMQDPEKEKKTSGQIWTQRALYLGSIVVLSWCMIRLSGSSYNPFIYFRF